MIAVSFSIVAPQLYGMMGLSVLTHTNRSTRINFAVGSCCSDKVNSRVLRFCVDFVESDVEIVLYYIILYYIVLYCIVLQ